MNTCIKKKRDFGKLTLIYGSRTSADIVYKEELDELLKNPDISVHLSIDVAEKAGPISWASSDQCHGVKPTRELIAVTCGPPS